ncbi:MAG: hypothetical protein QF535_20785 [Anaerolineales bacterium]|nr:hypothetical protein [Anaerolineales bacterium]
MVSDGDIETYYDYYNYKELECFVGFDFGADYQAEVESISYFLRIGSESEDFLGSVIEYSNDGSIYTPIMTQNEVMTDGWNFWQVEEGASKPLARYVRIKSTSASKCRFAEIEVEGIVYLKTDISNMASY